MPDPSTSSAIASMFASMSAICDERTDRFRAEIAQADELGPCEACGKGLEPLDESETLEESVRANALRLVYAVCAACHGEAQTQERLARWGVPRRVRHATFANYEVYDERQPAALAKVRAWVDDPKRWMLMLLGSSGTGKGHLASACLRTLRASAEWTSHVDLVDGYHGLDFSKRVGYVARYRRVPVLVIDEMGGKGKTGDTEELFYSILNLRYEESLKTILIGNIPWRAKGTGPDLYGIVGAERLDSRITKENTTAFCKWADYRAR